MTAYTTAGYINIPEIDYTIMGGKKITNEERDQRLLLLRGMKGKRESSQRKMEESLKSQGLL